MNYYIDYNLKYKMVLAKFEENLILLSIGNTWEESSKEWGFLYKRERPTKDNHCLCGYKLKHQYYYYNKNTKKIICSGMECKKHIDEHRGNKKYDNNFMSDLYAIGPNKIYDYDLESWCRDNEQIVWDRIFWRIDVLETEEQLNIYYDYIEDYWCDLINVNCLLEKINDKLQIIFDKEEKREEKYKLDRIRFKLEKEKEMKRIVMLRKKKQIVYKDQVVEKRNEIMILQQDLHKLIESANNNIRSHQNELYVLENIHREYCE